MFKPILTDEQRSKLDESDDCYFYSNPRLVHHLDGPFRQRLTSLYQAEIPKDSVVLDLMSSWVSHLPSNVRYKKVIGHGLNEKELTTNKRLDSYWIQNLNTDFKLPLEDNSIDISLIVAGWQYLQYPEYISSELYRITNAKGKLIVSFSNRAFWDKSPKIWYEGDNRKHIEYVKSILSSQGWSNIRVIYEKTPSNPIFNYLGITGDPFISVIAMRN